MRSPSYPMVPKVGVAVLDGGHSSLTGSRLEAAQFQPFYELQLENISLCCSNLTKVADDAFVYAGEIDNTLQLKKLSPIHNFAVTVVLCRAFNVLVPWYSV